MEKNMESEMKTGLYRGYIVDNPHFWYNKLA